MHSPAKIEEFTVAAILWAVVVIVGISIASRIPQVIAAGWAK